MWQVLGLLTWRHTRMSTRRCLKTECKCSGLLRFYGKAFSIYWTVHSDIYTLTEQGEAFLRFDGNGGYSNAPQYYSVLTLSMFFFYFHGSVHRNSRLIRSHKLKQYAGVYFLHNHSTYFRCPLHPSSGVYKTVTASSGTGHSIWETTFLERDQIWPRWRNVVAQILWPVPEAAVTVLCTPDNGCGGHRNM